VVTITLPPRLPSRKDRAMRLRIPALLLAMVACATVAVWVASDGLKAKQCLGGQLDVQQARAWSGASITDQGCEVIMATGEVVVVPISAPPFEVGVAAGLGCVALGTMALVLVTQRVRRPGAQTRIG
jgi:hypothetical protein